MNKSIPPVKGMPDIVPAEIDAWQFTEKTAAELLTAYGYHEIRLPLVERTELFRRSIGEVTDIVEKEMYTFESRGGTSLTLRPEATAGCVRAGITHGLLHNQRRRLWYQGPMFRYERPQAGRYRQFYQIGAEAFGLPGPDIDAEIILMLARLWRCLGIESPVLHINSLGDVDSRHRHRDKLIEYLSRNESALDDDSRRRLTMNPLRILDSKNPALAELIDGAPQLADFLDAEGRDHFDGVRARLDDAGIDYVVDPRLVRGLDYYNRTVFEWQSDLLGAQNAFCGGGRYDGLVAHLGGTATEAIGFALGLDRVVAILKASGATIPTSPPHLYVVSVGEAAARAGTRLSESLRDELPGLRMISHGSEGSMKAQMRAAHRSEAVAALILGDDEVAGRTAAVKQLRESARQETVSWDALAAHLARLID